MQSSVVKPNTTKRRVGGGSTLTALMVGLPLAVGLLALIHYGPFQDPTLQRDVAHPVECVEVGMFCCALGALLSKLLNNGAQRRSLRCEILPPWDGQRVGPETATQLMAHVGRLTHRVQRSALGQRVTAILDFVCCRGSAADLDDQMRMLTDNDALAVENSSSLLRFITWAIPILGFLGTVLGITQAIAGVTPEKLESNLSAVTDGLAEAFDSTALALALTMLTMFLSFLVDRAEQGTLEAVDGYVERHLAHRFERPGFGSVGVSDALRQDLRSLVETNERLVQRQAEIWAQTLEVVQQRSTVVEKHQQERFVLALEAALQKTLTRHEQQLGVLEKQGIEQTTGLVKQLGLLACSIRETGSEQQNALKSLSERIGDQANVLVQLQTSEKHLHRLQEALNQNLQTLTSTNTFEEALHSLTAAIHLFTARAGGAGGGSSSRVAA